MIDRNLIIWFWDCQESRFWNSMILLSIATETNPWWEGSLKEMETISKVTIFNRRDCCQDELVGFRILVIMDNDITFQYDDASDMSQEIYEINFLKLRPYFRNTSVSTTVRLGFIFVL